LSSYHLQKIHSPAESSHCPVYNILFYCKNSTTNLFMLPICYSVTTTIRSAVRKKCLQCPMLCSLLTGAECALFGRGKRVFKQRETDPKDQAPRPPEAANSDRTVGTRGREVRRVSGTVDADELIGCGCAGQVPRCKILHRHEHACSTSTSRHDTSRHAASCWPRCKSLHLHEHARRTGTHAT
jgi:hypothetical protein